MYVCVCLDIQCIHDIHMRIYIRILYTHMIIYIHIHILYIYICVCMYARIVCGGGEMPYL